MDRRYAAVGTADVQALLLALGFRLDCPAARYLEQIIMQAMGGMPPGEQMWAASAQAYGKSVASVRSEVSRGVHRVYDRDPERFSDALDELVLSAPRTRDFIAMAVRRLRGGVPAVRPAMPQAGQAMEP